MKRTVIFAAMLIGSPAANSFLESDSRQPAPRAEDNGFKISLDVNMVMLNAAVTNRSGYVSGLTAKNFTVTEEGKPQEIKFFREEDIPVAVGLIVDNSGSMLPKRQTVVRAARAFVRTSNPQDELFVVNFNEHAFLNLPLTRLSSATPAALDLALPAASPGGMTALFDAIREGLIEETRTGLKKKVLIVISDGGDNASKHKLSEIVKQVETSEATIYCIGLLDEAYEDLNKAALRRIAHASGGEAFFSHEAGEIIPVCERIAKDIRSQYAIGYISSNPSRNGKFRPVHVKATAPRYAKLTVRTRSGYLPMDREGGGQAAKGGQNP